MSEYSLDPELLTGDTVVDGQHAHLLNLERDLREALADGADHLQLGHVVFGILHYTQSHFVAEEALMERVGYPGLERQRAEHADFAEKAHRLASGVLTGRTSPADFHKALAGWLDEHVYGQDLELAAFVRSN